MTLEPPEGGFRGPVKRSVTIAGHATSISLEPIFWEALEVAAGERALPLNALIAAIDHARIQADDPPNLASTLRSWLMASRAPCDNLRQNCE
ncbi:MAG: aryl-sulfate sulfotransferase [Sphingomonadales bacterium]|nr:MAG: aryl-sulfate sulfotransferase [Sphingomonadales bacterium]